MAGLVRCRQLGVCRYKQSTPPPRPQIESVAQALKAHQMREVPDGEIASCALSGSFDLLMHSTCQEKTITKKPTPFSSTPSSPPATGPIPITPEPAGAPNTPRLGRFIGTRVPYLWWRPPAGFRSLADWGLGAALAALKHCPRWCASSAGSLRRPCSRWKVSAISPRDWRTGSWFPRSRRP
jgi:hypothetical protein